MAVRASWIGGLVVVLMACDPSTPDPDLDAGSRDSGLGDSGLVDSGPVDSGLVDSGLGDSGLSDSGVDDSGPAEGVPLEQIDETFGPAVCSYIYRCCDDAERSGLPASSSEAECGPILAATFNLESQVRTLSDAGELRYDPAAMEGCLRAARDAPCGSLLFATSTHFIHQLPACTAAMTPLLPDGAVCRVGSALQCESFSCRGATCTPLPGPGEACVATCALGLACRTGSCQPSLADGETCRFSFECASTTCEGDVCVSLCGG